MPILCLGILIQISSTFALGFPASSLLELLQWETLVDSLLW